MSESGKFVLRIDPKVHKALKEKARAKDLSLNQYIVQFLTREEIQKDQFFLNLIKQSFEGNIEAILLFGSTVRGDARTNSDIDLLLVLNDHLKVNRSLYKTWDENIAIELDKNYSPQFVSIPNLNTSVSGLWLEVALECEILYDKNGLIRKYLYQVKDKIAQGEYVRKLSHGHPYWTKRI